jgi:hypothetical protein
LPAAREVFAGHDGDSPMSFRHDFLPNSPVTPP